jgi:crotonobetainyl-CoA:carnitine CoA-transferase CaiB-like acyl-CoA transferase
VAAYQPARWKALCEIVGMPELLTDLRFIDLESRITHRVELVQALESRMSMQSKLTWITALEAADIICAPINNYAEVISAPPYIGADMEERIEHPSVGVISMPRSPLRSSGELPAARHPPPILGEHTREILLALGYSDTDMHRLFNFKLNNQQFAST